MSKMSRRIVVDASVARAAGTNENPVSTRSREFLQTMLTVCHRVVMTPEIEREWRGHRSSFSLSWLATMRRKRKVVSAEIDRDRREALVATILDSPDLGKRQRSEAEKDALLVTAAWAADGIVASNDARIRSYLSRIAATSGDLSRLVWVNPTEATESVVSWLSAGARSETSRQLGSHRTG